ncbi:hypothetical protein W97_02804 [Coniosporium apollinis CBS 100218]|uniref:Uncharacterized protein n=1 Tax=Coniosporium apollinis (strain CBS 100218) TaxID=1168221 RepID=R7YPJ9_CONA1|nr:uncharacterized protein W97_02804 [Coniosporium apollinis CBS 100218]EON63576.1 hypothetical protein W97_02804 [Coniosporium apollinis CBS 100218]
MGDWTSPVPRPLGWHASSAAQDAAQDAQDQAAPLQGPVQAQAAQSQALVAAGFVAAPTVAGRSIPILTNLLPVATAKGVVNTVPGSPDRWVAPPQCYMTAIEILTYFPEWLNWPECLMRFVDAGWEQVEMSKYVLWCRGLPKSRVTNYRTALWHRAKRARPVRARKAGFNTASWNVLPTRLSMNSLTDYRLADVVQNVVHHPPAAEQGEFWRCLNHQQSNAGLDLRLSDIPALLQAHPEWRSPAPAPGANPDGDALARWRLNPGHRTM